MQRFVMLTKVSSEALKSPQSFEQLEKKVLERIGSECPGVEWVYNLAVLGPYDYLDIFNAPDLETAFKVAAIVRSFGHASTEVWAAMEWKGFKELIRNLP